MSFSARMLSIELPATFAGLLLSMVAALVAVGAMTQIGSFRQETEARLEGRRYELLRSLDQILATITDAETGQRGYVLTDDKRYLEPYRTALAAITTQMASLEILAAQSPGLRRQLTEMNSLTTAKMAELHDSIVANDAHGQGAALTVIQTGRGKRLMDRIRQVIKQIQAEEEGGLAVDIESAHQQSRFGALEVAVWVPLVLGVLGLIAMLVRRARYDQRDPGPATSNRRWPSSVASRYSLAVCMVGLGAGSRWGIAWWVGELPPYITFYPAVLAVTVLAGAGPGMVAVVLSTALAAILFIMPVGSSVIERSSDFVAMGIFAGTNVAVCMLADRMQRAAWSEYQGLRTLLNGVKGLAVTMLDTRGVVAGWNGGAEKLNGYSAADAVGKNARVFYAAADIANGQPERDLDLARESGHSFGERMRTRQDGSGFWAEVSITAIKNSRGALIAFGEVTTDISFRRAVQEELATNAERYRMLVEDQSEFISLASLDGSLLFVNEAYSRFADRGSSSMGGTNRYDYVPLSDQEPVRLHMQRLTQAGARTSGDIHRMQSPTGRRIWTEWTHSALLDHVTHAVVVHSVGRDITDRKDAEDRLLETNQRFALAASAAELGFWDFDVGARTLRWDDQMFKLYGRERDHGAQPYELWSGSLHPQDRARAEQALRDVIERGGNLRTEFRVVWPTGETRHIKVVGAVIRDAEGLGVQVYGVNLDVTERRRADEYFRSALEAVPTGMLMIDEGGIIVLANAQIEAIFGYDRDELLGGRVEMLVPEPLRTIHAGLRGVFLADPKARLMGPDREVYGRRKDGTEVPIEVGLNPLQTPGGRFILSSIEDIGDRKRANEAQQRMTALVQSTSDAIVTKDLEGVIRSWNPAAEHLLGYTAEEIIGEPVIRLIPADRRDEEFGILARIKLGQRIANFETVRLRKDGSSVDVSLTISPVLGDGGRVVCASKIMRDITQQKSAAEALGKLNAELALQVKTRTSELKERESLLQEVHHRVKNNLQVISSLINMQIRGLEDQSIRAALVDCRSRVATMAQIHEMLYQSADYARVPFATYARDLAARVLSASRSSPSNVHLEFDMEEITLPVAQAIPCGLILNELVANSLKHAFPNAAQGTIRVELRRTADRTIILCVSDDGVGIAPSLVLENLSSLGLELVMTLVEQLEGRLEIIRQPGSTFKVSFPVEFTK